MAPEQYPGQPDFRRTVEPMPGAKESSGQKYVEPAFKPIERQYDPSTIEHHRYSCAREIRGHCVAFQKNTTTNPSSDKQERIKH